MNEKLKNILLSKRIRPLLIASTLFSVSSASQACSVDQYIGSVCITAATFCPLEFEEAGGQLLSINQNQALFSVLGTTYGGNGTTNFALPNLRGRSIIGSGQGVGLTSITQGQALGTESVRLTEGNLPVHTHPVTLSGTANTTVTIPISAHSGSNVTTPSGQAYLSASPPNGLQAAQIWSGNATPVATVAGVTASTTINGSTTVGATGGNQPIDNRPPQLALRYCIAVQGLYPPRP